MKASFKEKGIVMSWLIVFAVVVSLMVYFIFAEPKASGMITGVEIVNMDNTQQIETFKKYQTPHAFKVQEGGKFYLRYYYYQSNAPIESKLEVTSEQYNKLAEGNKYWVMVKFLKTDDVSSGTIKDIFTEDPTKR